MTIIKMRLLNMNDIHTGGYRTNGSGPIMIALKRESRAAGDCQESAGSPIFSVHKRDRSCSFVHPVSLATCGKKHPLSPWQLR